jgi:hypothetical protein
MRSMRPRRTSRPEKAVLPACGAKWATSRFVCVLGKRHSGLALRFAFVDPEVANTQVSTQLTVQPVEQGQEVKVQAEIQLDPEYGLGSYDRVSSTMHVPRKSPSGYASRSRPRRHTSSWERSMLRPSHAGHEYAKPSFSEPPPEVKVQQALARLVVIAGRSGDDPLALDDTGEPSVHEFARRFEDIRNMLVERKLRGDDLSAEEALVLTLINDALWSTMEAPKPESERVQLAAQEGELILRTLRDGRP